MRAVITVHKIKKLEPGCTIIIRAFAYPDGALKIMNPDHVSDLCLGVEYDKI